MGRVRLVILTVSLATAAIAAAPASAAPGDLFFGGCVSSISNACTHIGSIISGGSGVDRLLGQGGRGRLVGGPGRDRLVGGPGADRQRQ